MTSSTIASKRVGGERLERLAAVARDLDLVALERERARERLLHGRLIVDYEDLGPLAHRSPDLTRGRDRGEGRARPGDAGPSKNRGRLV